MITRRNWLKGCSCAALAGTAGCLSTGKEGDYSVVLIGDTHYDKAPETVYHAHYNEKVEWLNRVQRAEFKRNGEMWADRLPRLIRAAAKCARPDTRFAIQLGDLVQGDCGNGEVHKKMMADVLDFMKGEFGGLPFLTVTGNHDIRGVDAYPAYEAYMPGRLTKEMGFAISRTTFSFRRGPDHYLFIDFNKPANETVPLVKAALEANKGARYTFVITHGPMFPFDASAFRWFLYGNRRDDAIRREMLALFLKHNVICLAGHTHRLDWREFVRPEGRITQLIVSSVWTDERQKTPSVFYTDPAKLGTHFAFKEKDPKRVEDARALFAEYAPYWRGCYFADAAGYCRLEVHDKGVNARYYGGDGETPIMTFKLR
ncbi:MAG: metallophosphoesterase [Kiritimatiellae bacterium]|nr:metallophosphoesterase [Kiritimatiellia bacterium]